MKQRTPLLGEYVRGVGTLVLVDVIPPPPPPPPKTVYIFAAITAHCEVRRKGRKLDEFNSVWDFYGLAHSVEDSIRVAQNYCRDEEVTPQSDIEVVVVKETSFAARYQLPGENFYDKEFFQFDGENDYPELRRFPVPEMVKEVVWSSRAP